MANFGYDWLFLVTVKEEHILEYEKLLYYHELPFHTVQKDGLYHIQTPERYIEIGREIIKDYQSGILADPVNDFNPRYSNFERGKKVRYVARRNTAFKWHFLFLLIIMLLMLLIQMVTYIKK